METRSAEENAAEENVGTPHAERGRRRLTKVVPIKSEPDATDPTADDQPTTEAEPAVVASLEQTTEDEPVVAGKRSRAGYVLWVVAACAVVVIALAAFYFLRPRKAAATTEQTTATTEAPTTAATLSPEQLSAVAVEVVQIRTVKSDVTAPGRVVFNGNGVTPVFSQFSGRLVRLDAEVGATVRRGQVIGMIDTPDIVSSEADYQQALSNERTARTSLDLATRTRERAERLLAAEAIPQRDLQQAQADESHAKDDLERAQSAVKAARGKLQSSGMSDAEIKGLAAGARAVNRIVPLVAPIGGTVTERKAGVGQVVQPGAGDPLLMIADLSTVWINADLYEDQLASARTGAPVRIQTPAYPNETFAARVDQIGSTIDPDKHTVAVRCVVANPGGRLKPGMFASVILSSAAQQTALTVPASALVTEGDERSVFVEESPGRYVKRPVETGGEADGAVLIRSGLTEGERVVVRGGLLIAAQQGGE
jgi:cobalt-zinc-cadmium efflux system membrane fusion protein